MLTANRRKAVVAACGIAFTVTAAAGGFVIGTGNASSESDAVRAERVAYRQANASAIENSRKQGLIRGFRAGAKVGKQEARRAGRQQGRQEGGASASVKLAAIAEADAAQAEAEAKAIATTESDNIWCDTDGYCLQNSPGSGGPECPPGTVENAGGVVCVPLD